MVLARCEQWQEKLHFWKLCVWSRFWVQVWFIFSQDRSGFFEGFSLYIGLKFKKYLDVFEFDPKVSNYTFNFSCNNEYCQKDWTPFPNMGGGLTGYDPVFSDPLNEFGDPGLRNQIFKPTLEETDPETYRIYIPSYLNVEDNLRYVCINYIGQNHLLMDFVKK